MEELFTKSAVEYGILAVLVLFFVWQGQKREEKLAARLTTIENYINNELTSLVNTVTEALFESTNALQATQQTMKKLDEYLEQKSEKSHGSNSEN